MRLILAMIGRGQKLPDGSFGYQPARHRLGDAVTGETTPYHQTVIRRLLGLDQLWLVGTATALEAHAAQIPHDRAIAIPEGTTEEQLWDMGARIVEALRTLPAEGAPHDLHLDLTHGFRTQPLFLLAAARFACALEPQRLRLEEVHYAMWTAMFGPQEAVPILPVSAVLRWEQLAAAIRDFLDHGQGLGLVAQLRQTVKDLEADLGRNVRGRPDAKDLARAWRQEHPELVPLKRLAEAVSRFTLALRLNGTPAMNQAFREMSTAARDAATVLQGRYTPLGHACSLLAKNLRCAQPADDAPLWHWHRFLARWCLDRQLDQQALTQVEELTTTRRCEERGQDPLDKNSRKAAAWAVKEQLKSLERKQAPSDSLLQALHQVSELRNIVNHAWMQERENPLAAVMTNADGLRDRILLLLSLHDCDRLPDWPDVPVL